jgi:hypothetical protein
MRRGKSLVITSTVGALLALLGSAVGAGEIGVCPPYSKTFGPEDPPEAIMGFLAEVDAKPGGGTIILESGEYDALASEPIPIYGVVCIQGRPGDARSVQIEGAFHVQSGAVLTLKSLAFPVRRVFVSVSANGELFIQDLNLGREELAYVGGLDNEGFVFAVNSILGRVNNMGRFILVGGQITEDQVRPGLDNSGYAFLDGVRLIRSGNDNYKTYGGSGIRNRVSGVVSVTRSTIADNGSCCWYADACSGLCGDGGILNTEGGYVEIAQSIVANNVVGDCFGPVTDLGYNVFGPGGGCIVTASTSIEADPLFVVDEEAEWVGPELGPGSPAIDLIPLDLCPETDALGRPRTDGNGDGIVACDAGALEFSGTAIVVKSWPYWQEYGLVNLETDTALYVVFMSSAAFDPADVVVESVVLNDTGAVPRGWNYVDRNGDGVLDLRLRYKLKDVPLVCGQQTLAVSAMTAAGDSVGGELKLEVTGCVF